MRVPLWYNQYKYEVDVYPVLEWQLCGVCVCVCVRLGVCVCVEEAQAPLPHLNVNRLMRCSENHLT